MAEEIMYINSHRIIKSNGYGSKMMLNTKCGHAYNYPLRKYSKIRVGGKYGL